MTPTPREAQVQRFLSAAAELEVADVHRGVRPARMKEARTNGSLPFLTAQQKAIAGAAIDAFVAGLRAGSWPDMSTMPEAELESYREHAIAWLEQG